MNLISIKTTCLVFLLLLAVIKDLKSYKIPNSIVICGLIISFVLQIHDNGLTSIYLWLWDMLVPVILLFPLFLLKALGAGDIKLFSVIGSFFGITYVLKSTVIALFVAAIMSIIHLIRHKQILKRLQYLVTYIHLIQSNNQKKQGTSKGLLPYYDVKKNGYEGVIHFSIAILLSVIIQSLF